MLNRLKSFLNKPVLMELTEEKVIELFDPILSMIEVKFKELEKQKREIKALRGLIVESCSDCAHKSYCKNKDQYDETWMLGCQNWKESRPKRSDELSRYIGDVNSVLWD